MIDYVAAAEKAMRLLETEVISGRQPLLLVGEELDRRSTLGALEKFVGVPAVNLNLILAQTLANADNTRADVGAIVASLEPTRPTLLLDRIHILMQPQLKTNVLDVLCRVARRRAVCASWPGQLTQGRLCYANSNHPECVDEYASRALVFDLSNYEGISL